MEENQAKKTEIILPSKEEPQALAVPCQLHWKDVRYNIAVFIKKVGNPLAGESIVADHVVGRCMGDRSDGKVFFASVIIPWIWEDKEDWRITARARLDSFLFPDCQCDSRTEETKVCEFHLYLIAEWEAGDRRVMEHTRAEAKKMPPAREGGGVFEQGKAMHRDYPWCREQDGRFMCTICGYGKDPREALGNPTYRNIFIRDHSHCGFGNPDKYAPAKKEDLERLKQITSEALDPSTAYPGHALGCVCHRCRIGGENKERTIEALDVMADSKSFHRAEAVCLHCFRDLYRNPETKVWYHLDLMRACHWSGTTVATA